MEEKKTNTAVKKSNVTAVKKTTTAKKGTPNKGGAKKNTNKPAVKKTPKKKVSIKVDNLKSLEDTGEITLPKESEMEQKIIEEVNKENFVQPAIDVKAYDKIEENKEEIEEIKQEMQVVSQPEFIEENIKEELEDVKEYKTLKKDRFVDAGILIVVIGLFVLVVTAFLNNSMNLKDNIVMDLVIVSLSVEVIGIILIFISAFKKK